MIAVFISSNSILSTSLPGSIKIISRSALVPHISINLSVFEDAPSSFTSSVMFFDLHCASNDKNQRLQFSASSNGKGCSVLSDMPIRFTTLLAMVAVGASQLSLVQMKCCASSTNLTISLLTPMLRAAILKVCILF